MFNAEDRARQTLATSIGGLLLLLSAFLTLRNVRAAERNAEIARRNVEIAQDKQITDRFTAAVTNLSNDADNKMALRLGGIYALERIARDSPNDHWTVMEVLTAHVRDKCPTAIEMPGKIQFVPTRTPTDIQAILTVIGRRKADQDGNNRLDLYEVYIPETDFEKASLKGADLRGANLARSLLLDADLRGADLRGVDLTKADLENANLCGAVLQGANLQGAKFGGANLQQANLSKTSLVGCDLMQLNLTAADLAGADLTEAELWEADLRGASFLEAELRAAKNLTQEQLNSADQTCCPKSLPFGLTFPGYVPPEPSPAPTAPPPPDEEPPVLIG